MDLASNQDYTNLAELHPTTQTAICVIDAIISKRTLFQSNMLASLSQALFSNLNTQIKAQKLKTLLKLSRPNANGKNQNTNPTFKRPLQNSPLKLILEIWSSVIMVSFTVPSRAIQLQKFHGSKINFQFYQKLDQNIDHAINMV